MSQDNSTEDTMSQDNSMTQKLRPLKLKTEEVLSLPDTPIPSSSPVEHAVQAQHKGVRQVSLHLSRRQEAMHRLIREECRSFCLSLFFQEQPVRSLGITSSIAGEGKSFVAAMLAQVLAQDSPHPVILIECNWEHSGLGYYLGCPKAPGIAEWLRGECAVEDIQYQIQDNLTFIPAGHEFDEAMTLLQKLKKVGLRNTLARNNENILIELPPIVTTAYSMFAASLVEALALVVRAGVTPDYLIAEACSSLSTLPMKGMILNQVEGHYKLRHSMYRRV